MHASRMISSPTKACAPSSSIATRASLFRTRGTVVAWLWNICRHFISFEVHSLLDLRSPADSNREHLLAFLSVKNPVQCFVSWFLKCNASQLYVFFCHRNTFLFSNRPIPSTASCFCLPLSSLDTVQQLLLAEIG